MALLNLNFPTSSGTKQIVLDLDERYSNEKTILQHLKSGMFYEPDVSLAMLRLVREGDCVIDVGANVGFFSTLLGGLVGPSGRVVSFEPGEHNLNRLKNNLTLNGFDHVTVIEQPATDKPGTVTFFINSDDSGGNALWDPAQFPGNQRSKDQPLAQTLIATTLDDEIRRLGIGTPRLLKIDTEGAEQRVLEGAASLIQSRAIPFIIAELHEFGLHEMGCSQTSLRGLMEGHGYSTFLLSRDGSLPKFIPAGTQLRSPYFLNLLFSTPDAVASCWPVEEFSLNSLKPR